LKKLEICFKNAFILIVPCENGKKEPGKSGSFFLLR